MEPKKVEQVQKISTKDMSPDQRIAFLSESLNVLEQSGLSQNEFVEAKGSTANSLGKWKKRLSLRKNEPVSETMPHQEKPNVAPVPMVKKVEKISTEGMSPFEKRVFWAEKVKAFEASGLTLEKFGELHGVSHNTLRKWKKQLKSSQNKQVPPTAAAQEKPSVAPVPAVKKVERISTKDMSRSERHAFWTEKVKAFEASGLTLEKFGELHGVNPNTLREWKGRLKLWKNKQLLQTAAAQEKPKAAPVPVVKQVQKIITKRMSESEKRVFWAERVKASEASGLTLQKFGQLHGINRSTLWGWRRRLESESSENKWIPQKAAEQADPEETSLTLQKEKPAASLELRHQSSGFSIVVTEGIDEALLKKVLNSLSDIHGQ